MTCTLHVDIGDTVMDIKHKLKDAQGTAPERQQLRNLHGRVLADNHTLMDYRVQEHATLQLRILSRTRSNAPLQDTTAFARCIALGRLEDTTEAARCAAQGLARGATDGGCSAVQRRSGQLPGWWAGLVAAR
mmetsp:Transcript_22508/g.70044  ORF Transcript_22508/g.70044 Transcript_22508/m.70044 type:complete len:132 (-) Transcript_22508:129-524(-)